MKLTQDMRKQYFEDLTKAFDSQIDGMGRGFTKKTAADLKAGFRDGVTSALNGLGAIAAEGWEKE